jgi:hypothetical protein
MAEQYIYRFPPIGEVHCNEAYLELCKRNIDLIGLIANYTVNATNVSCCRETIPDL